MEVEVVVVVEVELVEVLAEVEAGSQKVHRDDLIKTNQAAKLTQFSHLQGKKLTSTQKDS